MANWVKEPKISRIYGWGIMGWGGAWGRPTWTLGTVGTFATNWTRDERITEGSTTWT